MVRPLVSEIATLEYGHAVTGSHGHGSMYEFRRLIDSSPGGWVLRSSGTRGLAASPEPGSVYGKLFANLATGRDDLTNLPSYDEARPLRLDAD